MKEAKVIVGARDHDRVAADIGEDGEVAAELVGAHLGSGGTSGSGDGGGDRSRSAIDGGAADRVTGASGGGGLAGDERGNERRDLLGVGVAQEDHVGLRVRVGFLVERLDQLIKEIMLVGRAHEEHAVSALVGEEGRARAEAERRAAGGNRLGAQHRRELVDQVGGHRVFERVALGHDEVELGAVEFGDQFLDLLEVRDRVGDQEGVVTAEVDGRRSEGRVEARDDLRDELLGIGVLERVDLRGDTAAGRQRESRAREQRRRLGLRDEVRDDLQELVTLLDDGDAVEVEERLDREQRFIAGDRSRQRKRVDAGREGLRAEDGFARPALHQVEDLGDGLVAQDDRTDLVGATETRERDGGDDASDRGRGGGGRRGRCRSGLREAHGRRQGGGEE